MLLRKKVEIGAKIEWDPTSKKTIGCELCKFTEDSSESDSNNNNPLDDIDYNYYLSTRDWA